MSENQNESNNLNQTESIENVVPAKSSATEQPLKDTTAKTNLNRISSNGKTRVVGIVAGIVLLGGGLIGLKSCGSHEQPTQQEKGTIDVPNTNAQGSTTMNQQQAELVREQQAKKASQLAGSDGSYVPPLITVHDTATPTNLAPTQPGIDSNYSKPGQSNSLPTSAIPPGMANSNVGQGQQKQTSTTYQITPLNTDESATSTNSKTNSNSSVQTGDSADLGNASKNVDTWHDQYLAKRAEAAKALDEKSTMAFKQQLDNLAGAAKPATRMNNTSSQIETAVLAPSSLNSGTFAEPKNTTQGINSESQSASADIAPLIKAGTTFRARLITEVNTDAGNEVLAKVIGGKYNGAQLVGTVQIKNNDINLHFSRLLPVSGKELAIDALARQIGTNSPAMADSIDKHYISRYTALAASSALNGYGDAYRQTAQSAALQSSSGSGAVVVAQTTDPTNKRIVGNVIGDMGQNLSSEIQKQVNQPTTYKTDSGKIFNLFFNQDVTNKALTNTVNSVSGRASASAQGAIPPTHTNVSITPNGSPFSANPQLAVN